jgi:hypothetical protein
MKEGGGPKSWVLCKLKSRWLNSCSTCGKTDFSRMNSALGLTGQANAFCQIGAEKKNGPKNSKKTKGANFMFYLKHL